MATQNIEEIVRGIIDNLSDGVAELVLMVVVLAEQNQPMPADLPGAASAVNGTADKLSKIAKQLATKDYAQFPSIAKEINDAASAVESATSVMGGAIKTLAGAADRKKGWDNLVDACRVMSGKTIRLLHIIYGAPLQRLFLNADNLADALDQFEPRPKGLGDQANQQKVLDNLKTITEPALRMQKHLQDRAKNADTPEAKAALDKAGQDVRDKVQGLVDAVNKGFNDPNNADFTRPLADLRDAVQGGRDDARRNAPPAPAAIAGKGPRDLDDAVERAKAAARDVPRAISNPKDFAPATDKVKDEVGEVRKRIDPKQGNHDWTKEVEAPLAEQYKAARDALKNQTPESKKALDKATDDLVRALDNIKNPDNGFRGGNEDAPIPYNGAGGPKGPTGGRGQYVAPEKANDFGFPAVPAPGRDQPVSSGAPGGYNRPQQGGQGGAPNSPPGGYKGGPGGPGKGQQDNRPENPDGPAFKRNLFDPIVPSAGPGNVNSGNPGARGGAPGGPGNNGGNKGPGGAPATPFGKTPTPQQVQQFKDQAKKIAEPLNKAITRPEDKEQEARERLKDALNNARNAADRQDPKAMEAHAKGAAKAAKDLAQQFRDRANDPNSGLADDERDDRRNAADDLEKLVPPFREKQVSASKDPKNDVPVNDFKEAARKLERAADRGTPDPYHVAPLSKKEVNDLKDHMNKAADAAKRGDNAAKQKHLDAAKPLIDRARNFAVQKGRGIPDPDRPDGPSDELMALWKKFANARDPDLMKKLVDDFDNAYGKLDKATGASPVAAAQDLEDALDDIQGAVDSGVPSRLAPAAKRAQDKYNDFVDQVNKASDPAVKAAGQKAATDLKPQLEDLIKKAAEAVKDPKNQDKAHAVENDIPPMKKPLADFKQKARPQKDDLLDSEALGAAVKEAQAKLKDALPKGNPAATQKAVDDLKKALGDYNDHAKQMRDQAPPEKRPALDNKLADLEKEMKKLDNINKSTPPSAVQRAVDGIPSAIDDFDDELKSDAKDDAIKSAAKANNLVAFLNDIDEPDMDLGDLLTTAGELSDLMRGLVNPGQVAADLGASGGLTDVAQSALDLGDLLSGLDGGWASPDASEQVSQKMNAIRGGNTPSSPFAHAPSVSLENAKSFEDITTAVAWKIHQQSKEIAIPSKTAENVALELSHLASAARSGKKQDLLLSAKAASGQIQAYAKELAELAAKIPGRNAHERETKEQLLRSSQGLKNYAMHLKILTSVKAASIEESRDTDESLSTIARDLGDIITQSLGSMRTVYTTMKI